MKIRSDFVSNSSSSSFIVKGNAKKAIKLINDLGNIPYPVDSNLSFGITYKHKDADEIYEELLETEYEYNSMNYWDEDRKDDPEAIEHCYIQLYKLEEVLKDKNPILDKIVTFSIVTSENDTLAMVVLNMLYRYFQKKGLEVDASETEVDFLEGLSNRNFLLNLVAEISNNAKGRKKKCHTN